MHEPRIFPALLDHLTVQVSEMFRDPGYFRALREQVVPLLRTYPSLKVWVAGCSAGRGGVFAGHPAARGGPAAAHADLRDGHQSAHAAARRGGRLPHRSHRRVHDQSPRVGRQLLALRLLHGGLRAGDLRQDRCGSTSSSPTTASRPTACSRRCSWSPAATCSSISTATLQDRAIGAVPRVAVPPGISRHRLEGVAALLRPGVGLRPVRRARSASTRKGGRRSAVTRASGTGCGRASRPSSSAPPPAACRRCGELLPALPADMRARRCSSCCTCRATGRACWWRCSPASARSRVREARGQGAGRAGDDLFRPAQLSSAGGRGTAARAFRRRSGASLAPLDRRAVRVRRRGLPGASARHHSHAARTKTAPRALRRCTTPVDSRWCRSRETAQSSTMMLSALAARGPRTWCCRSHGIAALLQRLCSERRRCGGAEIWTESHCRVIKCLLVDDLQENLLALSALLQSEDVEILTRAVGSRGPGAAAASMISRSPFSMCRCRTWTASSSPSSCAAASAPGTFPSSSSRPARASSSACSRVTSPARWTSSTSRSSRTSSRTRPTCSSSCTGSGQQLAQELKERTETLRLNEMFSALLAHDLRNPLSAILASAQLLKRRIRRAARRRMPRRASSRAAST